MITEENKNLLFKDLSGRLSYGVKVAHTTLSDNMPKVWDVIGLPAVGLVDIIVPGKYRFAAVPVEEIKPYLRSMDSMTEEEREEYDKWHEELEEGRIKDWKYAEYNDWLNAHRFDYSGLIEKDLAIKATEGMYE